MTLFKHRTSSGKTRTRHAVFEVLEDRRLLAAVSLDLGTTYQTIQGWGSAPLYPSQVSTAQAGAIMKDAGFNTVRILAGPGEFTYTTGGNLTTPVPISANLADNVAKFGYTSENTQADLVKWLTTNGLEPSRTKIIGALWSPPHWLKITTGRLITWNNNTQSGYDPVLPYGAYGGNTGAGRVNPTMWTDWARYVLSDVEWWGQQTGLPMYAFSFQNEPNVPTSYSSCTFDEIANDVNNPSAGYTAGHWDIYGDAVQALATELAAHPEITTKFFGPELSQLGGGSSLTSCNPYNLGAYNAVRQNLISRGLLNVLGGWATHEYTNASGGDAALWDAWYNGSQHAANIVSNGTSNYLDWLGPTPGIAGDNKEIWQTETGGEDQSWTKDGAMAYGLKIFNALVYGHVSGYATWDLTGYNSTDTSGLVQLADINNPTNSYKFDAFKQFSRWIRPGAQRIKAVFENGKASIGGANELDTYNGLNVSAFNQTQDKRLTMVFVNMETSDQSTTITIPAGLGIATYQVFVTSGTQKYVQLANLTPSNGQITLTIPASSFVTITGSYATMVPPTVATPAAATPNPALGTTTNLSVLGADTTGEANLTYTWSVTSKPTGAADPTFTVNGTNAAKNTTATFSKAGSYQFTVTLSNVASLSVTSTVGVTVILTLSSIAVSPSGATVAPNGQKQFSATAYDQFGAQISSPSGLVWSNSSSNLGSINAATGLYTATQGVPGLQGITTVTATVGAVSGSATVNVTTLPAPSVCYRLDDGSGTTAFDSSGNGHSGTLVNGPTWTTGESNGGLALNGTSQYVTVPALNLNSNTVTMSGWIKRNGTQSDYTGIVFYRNGSGTASGISMRSTGALAYHWNDVSGTYNWSSGLTVPDGVWTFVALVITASNATMYMQPAGGAMQSAVNAVANATQAFSGATCIGQDSGGGRFFKGSLDDIRIFNTALNAANVAQLYDSYFPPTVSTAASANPATVTGTTSTLSVQGASSVNLPLSYTWSALGTPPAPVTFSPNGTNLAKNATATFSKAGTYALGVTIVDTYGQYVTGSVNVTVSQTLTSIAVALAANYLATTGVEQFTANAYDQFNNPLVNQPTFAWSVVGAGPIDASGNYQPPYATGSAVIRATSGSLTGQATATYPGVAQWNSTGDGTWTGGNWIGTTSSTAVSPPGLRTVAGDYAQFATSGGTISLSGISPTLAGISFAGASGYTLSDGTMNLSNGANSATITVSSGNHSIATPITLQSNLTATVSTNDTLTIAGGVSGSGKSLTLNGPGKLVLGGLNNLSGATVLSGTLVVAGPDALPSGSNLAVGANVDSVFGAAPVVPAAISSATASFTSIVASVTGRPGAGAAKEGPLPPSHGASLRSLSVSAAAVRLNGTVPATHRLDNGLAAHAAAIAAVVARRSAAAANWLRDRNRYHERAGVSKKSTLGNCYETQVPFSRRPQQCYILVSTSTSDN